ncbi:hypothetical protein [uncultured Microbacterium sp.]|uniref:hypothetical protein n=1 Tax=uncultured Microbacterium sp. TaxID=191216 RepID=UPI002621421E|nr:hypothetical protein [uncultured Microbacterium sp.]
MALLAMTLTACSTSSLRIITNTQPEPSGMEALLVASLESGDDGCVFARTAGGIVALVWPAGYSVSGDPDSFTVHDSEGVPVASSGVDVSIGGGSIGGLNDDWSNKDCGADDLWVVGQISTPAGEQ